MKRVSVDDLTPKKLRGLLVSARKLKREWLVVVYFNGFGEIGNSRPPIPLAGTTAAMVKALWRSHHR